MIEKSPDWGELRQGEGSGFMLTKTAQSLGKSNTGTKNSLQPPARSHFLPVNLETREGISQELHPASLYFMEKNYC